ncbi:hypothetical protein EYF80_053188 [Liparis tanakae]|uniref:Uncharacterized protein n=1 Tax=Liparis tanakae TaxID=230148 RepID=A0A4Z2F783_9TELE|nr:hypothetical protein EYF80_053188 [Liparis tanakae]
MEREGIMSSRYSRWRSTAEAATLLWLLLLPALTLAPCCSGRAAACLPARLPSAAAAAMALCSWEEEAWFHRQRDRKAALTCLWEWWADTARCCIAARTCLYCWDTSTSLLDSDGEEVLLEREEEEEAEEAACCRMRCSISCSCWSAFTKAAFSRLVCSAFRAFF